MKIKLLNLIILLFITLPLFCQSLSKPYNIKAGKLKYSFQYGPQKGYKYLYFDDWGRIERVEIEVENDPLQWERIGIENPPITEKFLYIKVNDTLFVINNIDSTAEFRIGQGIGSFSTPYYNKDSILEKENLLGLSCEVFTFQNFLKFWSWNRIYLKKQLVGLNDGEEIIEINELIEVDPKLFQVPTYIKITNSE